MLLDRTSGDLDYAVRAYNRGLVNAFDSRGDAYHAAVRRRLYRFIRNRGAPVAWAYIWRSDREARLDEWPWIAYSARRSRDVPVKVVEGAGSHPGPSRAPAPPRRASR